MLAGTGLADTAKTVEQTLVAAEMGAQAALVVTPYYNKPSQRGMYEHYRAIAEAVDVLRQWQGIERDAIETTAQIMEKTDNLLIRQVMEIIRNDSVQHHRVQQFLIDSMTKTPVSVSPVAFSTSFHPSAR